MKNVLAYIKKIIKKLNPLPPIGGLSITDSAIRFFFVGDDGKTKMSSLRLPPGIVDKGRVKDKKELAQAIRKVHNNVFAYSRDVHIILSLSQRDVYTQVFTLPRLEDEKLKESAKLNLQMISPIAFDTAYADWQYVDTENTGGSIDVLGAFIEKKIVNEFSEILEASGFMITAVEFPALSLVRLLRSENVIKNKDSYAVVDATTDGILFIIVRNTGVYFSHSISWKALQEHIGEQKIESEVFQGFLSREMQKLINFSITKGGSRIQNIIIFSGWLTEAMRASLAEGLAVPIQVFESKQFPKVEAVWFRAIGSALRGKMSRAEDSFISLTDAPVQARYYEARVLNFIHLWKNIGITVSAFILIMFLGADSYLAREAVHIEARTPGGAHAVELTQVTVLQAEAKTFNQLIYLIQDTQAGQVVWEDVISKMLTHAGGDITLRHLAVNGKGIVLLGSATDETKLLIFKERLIKDPLFITISLPLSNIKSNPNGSVDFTLSMSLGEIQ